MTIYFLKLTWLSQVSWLTCLQYTPEADMVGLTPQKQGPSLREGRYPGHASQVNRSVICGLKIQQNVNSSVEATSSLWSAFLTVATGVPP